MSVCCICEGAFALPLLEGHFAECFGEHQPVPYNGEEMQRALSEEYCVEGLFGAASEVTHMILACISAIGLLQCRLVGQAWVQHCKIVLSRRRTSSLSPVARLAGLVPTSMQSCNCSTGLSWRSHPQQSSRTVMKALVVLERDFASTSLTVRMKTLMARVASATFHSPRDTSVLQAMRVGDILEYFGDILGHVSITSSCIFAQTTQRQLAHWDAPLIVYVSLGRSNEFLCDQILPYDVANQTCGSITQQRWTAEQTGLTARWALVRRDRDQLRNGSHFNWLPSDGQWQLQKDKARREKRN